MSEQSARASFTTVLTKGCGENNDEDCSRSDEALSTVLKSHGGYCYMEVLSKRA